MGKMEVNNFNIGVCNSLVSGWSFLSEQKLQCSCCSLSVFTKIPDTQIPKTERKDHTGKDAKQKTKSTQRFTTTVTTTTTLLEDNTKNKTNRYNSAVRMKKDKSSRRCRRRKNKVKNVRPRTAEIIIHTCSCTVRQKKYFFAPTTKHNEAPKSTNVKKLDTIGGEQE